MKKLFILIFLIKFVIFNFSLEAAESYVVFKVNNLIITNVDISEEYRYLIALNKDLEGIEKKRILELAKESIIREKIKEIEIKKYFDLSKPNKFINRIIENFYKKLGIENENDFKKYLSGYELSYEDVKRKIGLESAWNDLISSIFVLLENFL